MFRHGSGSGQFTVGAGSIMWAAGCSMGCISFPSRTFMRLAMCLAIVCCVSSKSRKFLLSSTLPCACCVSCVPLLIGSRPCKTCNPLICWGCGFEVDRDRFYPLAVLLFIGLWVRSKLMACMDWWSRFICIAFCAKWRLVIWNWGRTVTGSRKITSPLGNCCYARDPFCRCHYCHWD